MREAHLIDRDLVTVADVDATPVRCPDPAAAAAMEALVLEMRKEGDSVGGVGEFVVRGCPAGLGEPVFDKLKADLAKALRGASLAGIHLHTTLNLDGGRSSEIWVSGSIAGRPTFTRPLWNKPVRNFLVLKSRD